MRTQIRMIRRLVWLLLVVWSGPALPARADTNTLDPAQFKDPPGEFRGIHWQGFNLSRPTDAGVRAGVQS
ncbi:MAG: hypothetical protein ABSA47_13220, partial [Verrucomicrobiota bacterium]